MNYYNDISPESCAWLKELIADGLIPDGGVDGRSIADVKPDELYGFSQCHFFAGIGGWPEAFRLAGFSGPAWSGSCPCQPFSCAGKGLGTKDERHLWPEFFRLIKECKPPFVFGEQVSSTEVVGSQLEASFIIAVQSGDYAKANKLAHKLSRSSSLHYWRRWVDGIRTDLETAGYSVWFRVLGAHSVGAPHIRQRLFWGAVRLDDTERENKRGVFGGGGKGDQQDTRRRGSESDGAGASRGLDNAGVQGPQRRERTSCNASAERRSIGQSSTARGLEFSPCDGRQQRRAESDGRGAVGGCGFDGVGLPDGARSFPRDQSAKILGHGDSAKSASSRLDGLADTGHPSGKHSPEPKGWHQNNGYTFWSDSTPILCRDGKTRRIPTEPTLFPMADGIPGRVGLLRGAGNAILSQVAAIFIISFMEAIHETVFNS